MRKAFYVFAIVALVATAALAGVNRVAKAAGTVTCNTQQTDTTTDISTCNFSVSGLPGGLSTTVFEVQNEDIAAQSGDPPAGLHFVGPGVNVLAYDASGNLVTWVNPPIKICFPVYDGQVKRWASASEVSSWIGSPVSTGVWEPIATVYETVGMTQITCGITYELPGPFAVFHTDASAY